MCQIIDQDIFSSETFQIHNHAQQKNHETFLYKSIFQDGFSNLKFIKNNNPTLLNFIAFGTIHLFHSHLQLLVSIQYSINSYQITGTIIQHGRGITIQQNQFRRSLSKQFRKKYFTNLFQNFIILFSIDNGQWLIKSPIIYSGNENIKLFKKNFHRIKIKLMEISMSVYMNISKLLNQNFDNLSELKKAKLNHILRYYNRCTTQPSISIKSDCAQYQTVMIRYSVSRCGLQDLLIQNRKANQYAKQKFQCLSLYGQKCVNDSKSKYLDEITLKQKQRIQQQILIPSYSLSKNNKQNKFIYNNCYFFRKKYQQTLIAQGGNANVYVIKPQIYQYTSSNTIDQKTFQKSQLLSKYLSKHLVFKKYDDQNHSRGDKQNLGMPHQNQIVSHLRGGSCVFLPKYYHNIQKQSIYQNKVFMDYLPGQTLDQFLLLNSRTISTLTKFYILLQILQALRFLNQFGIVHLDIKEKNIIIMKNIVSKLFDFGESYHYRVCGQNYKPKYTMMYGCPEAVTSFQGRVFTQKSDIFSFGIMAYKILFGRYPYIFRDKERFQKCNFNKNLRDKTFFCPQSAYDYGYLNIFEVIGQLVIKCIDIDEYKRPYLDWLTIILKCSLNYITNQ